MTTITAWLDVNEPLARRIWRTYADLVAADALWGDADDSAPGLAILARYAERAGNASLLGLVHTVMRALNDTRAALSAADEAHSAAEVAGVKILDALAATVPATLRTDVRCIFDLDGAATEDEHAASWREYAAEVLTRAGWGEVTP